LGFEKRCFAAAEGCLVYLDLNKWVDLASAEINNSAGEQYKSALTDDTSPQDGCCRLTFVNVRELFENTEAVSFTVNVRKLFENTDCVFRGAWEEEPMVKPNIVPSP
jgi:hypothetical protein